MANEKLDVVDDDDEYEEVLVRRKKKKKAPQKYRELKVTIENKSDKTVEVLVNGRVKEIKPGVKFDAMKKEFGYQQLYLISKLNKVDISMEKSEDALAQRKLEDKSPKEKVKV